MFVANSTALNSMTMPEETAPGWVGLLPAGQVAGRDGRAWINDIPDAVIASFAESGLDIPVDFEHATELKAPQGEPAPAAGWIKELQSRNGELWGRVEWTAKGREAVSSKEYRYLSPVIVFDRATNRIVRLTSVGLTNRPNLHLPALNRQLQPEEELSMNQQQFAALLAALGLAANATAEQALNHVTKLQGDLATACNRAEQPPLDKFVPRADHDAALAKAANAEQKLTEVQAQITETAINAEIDTALKAGKITPATVEYHKAQCRMDGGLDRFKAFCQAAPTVAADTSASLSGRPMSGVESALNAEEAKVAAMFGNSVEDLIKYGKGE